VDCQLEALPKKGGVKGSAKSNKGGSLTGATIKITDSSGKVHTVQSDSAGSFLLKDLPLGKAKVMAQADGHMMQFQQLTIRPRENVDLVLTLNKRPRRKNVRVVGKQIRVMKKIHFEVNSAVIKGDSNTLLEEIADVLHRNSNIRRVEIQGHTDNTGSRKVNKRLSQERADSVRTWLSEHGIAANRLSAKGYGSARPLAPNVTPANRARNRRVQFIILEKN
jgi:outer membrane protein OmpA-like peptidoglycan-associated protein